LIKLGYTIVILDVQNNTKELHYTLNNNKYYLRKVNYFVADIRNVSTVRRIIKQFDKLNGIIHFAAVSTTEDCAANITECLSVNVNGTEGLLQVVESSFANTSVKPWIIFGSSREVYGNVDPNLPADEDTPLLPVNVYGKSKLVGELLLAQYMSAFSNIFILRFADVYGSLLQKERLVPNMIKTAMMDAVLYITDVNKEVDYVHIHDVISICIKAVQKLEKYAWGLNSTINRLIVGSGETTDTNKLVSVILEITASRSPLILLPSNRTDTFSCNIKQMKRVLGYIPAYSSLEAGLQKYVYDLRRQEQKTLETIYKGECSSAEVTSLKLDKCTRPKPEKHRELGDSSRCN
ncbi:unnamed protein product, partial [Didymodactylos carnosus]